MGETAAKAHNMGNDARESSWLDYAIRAGLVAYGAVHLIVAWLAAQLALGDKSESASNTGALQTLAKQPMGSFLVWLVAIGMLLLVLWRVLEFATGHREESDESKRWRKRAGSLGKAFLYAVLAWSAFKTATRSGSSGGNTDSTTAKLMDLPAGQFIVGAVGLAIIGYGALLVYRGWTDKFMEKLDAQGQSGKDGSTYQKLGKAGYIAKGIAIILVGGLFAYAAITHTAKKSGGLDQALQTVREQPFGQVLLLAIALGIACYGLFCFARARHLDE
ncbi:MAG: hypothetical protein JWN68_274 [Nocardioides sp.]|jgi:hypothetical protein|uniref:DUF1206 domain-containing protein n=1 Tax=Nocardioides sp. TaxID=35761 RepID=UPI0026224287|nr:DUF1206 domain-containing protein [Nocardioides sp.]MCW2832321.1 hypothetical protein [Nocardioides sp.]